MRPEEPPSSATVTTAVRWRVIRRQARSAAARPCPPPKATTRGGGGEVGTGGSGPSTRRTSPPTARLLLAAEVAVAGHRGHALGGQPAGELLGDGDAAVLPAGAADGEGQIALALAAVPGHQHPQHVGVAVEELRRVVLAEDVVADLSVPAGLRPQLGDPVRI